MAHTQAVSALAFSPDGCFLYSGGEDAMVSSWNMLAAVDPDGGEAFKVLLTAAADKKDCVRVRMCWKLVSSGRQVCCMVLDAPVGVGQEEGDALRLSSFFPPSSCGICLIKNPISEKDSATPFCCRPWMSK